MKVLKKPIVLAGAAAAVLLVVAYFVVLPMLTAKPGPAVAAKGGEPAASPMANRPKRSDTPGMIYPLKERVLNLASPIGTTHYARIELSLDFARAPGAKPPAADPKAKSPTPLEPGLQPVTERLPQIDDAIVRIVGSKTLEGLTTTEGKDQLKKDIMAAVTDIVSKPDLQAVYIVQLVVQ
jgi:flagellar basal body-associated protein FliL